MNKGEAIAQQLRQAREQQGKSIQQVHQYTGVSPNVLHGLEKGDFGVVESVYTRLALRTYAEHLGLDAEALVSQYDAEFGRPLPQPKAPLPRPTTPVSRPAARPGPSEGFGSLTRLLVICVAGLAVVFGAVYWFDRDNPSEERESGPQLAPISPDKTARLPAPAPAPLASQEPYRPELPAPDSLVRPPTADLDLPPVPLPEATAPASSPVPGTAPPGSASQTAGPAPGTASPGSASQTAGPALVPAAELAPPGSAPRTTSPAPVAPTLSSDSLLVLEAEAVDSTWVRVDWDQGGQFETILRPGARRRWEARDHFLVQSGRGHGLRLWLQGRPLGADGLVGDPNRVLRVRISREGLTLLNRELQPQGSAPSPRDTAATSRPDSVP